LKRPGNLVRRDFLRQDSVLKTWPANSLWSEFLIAVDISDADCTSAAGQLDVFVEKLQWGKVESPLTYFIACVQLWYYGLPKEKV
jgi:hypothetical protein